MSAEDLFGTEDDVASLDADLTSSDTAEDGLAPLITTTVITGGFVTATVHVYSLLFEC